MAGSGMWTSIDLGFNNVNNIKKNKEVNKWMIMIFNFILFFYTIEWIEWHIVLILLNSYLNKVLIIYSILLNWIHFIWW